MPRRTILTAAVTALICAGLTPASGAQASPVALLLPQSTAFSVLGASCGGIQEQAFATGFDPAGGYPTGDVYLQTRCGGSGRGGGYKSNTYYAWVAAGWDLAGAVHSYSRLSEAPTGLSPSFSAEDARGDRVHNTLSAVNVAPESCTVGNTTYCTYRAYLEPVAPAAPPAAPTSVTATQEGEQFLVGWVPDPEAAAMITSSTVTATPVGSGASVLTATASGSASSALVGPLAPATTYQVTVVSTDAGGTSASSTPIEVLSGGSPPPPPPAESCEQNSGTIKLVPGLEETPHIQSVTVKGKLTGCDGAVDATEASYVAHLTTSEEVGCAALSSPLGEATTSVSLVVNWLPIGSGKSKGTFSMPLTESSAVAIGGTFAGGPLATPLSITGGAVWEMFKGAAYCGVAAPGKTTATPVKSGIFSGTAVELG
jgi:hypothetical protein